MGRLFVPSGRCQPRCDESPKCEFFEKYDLAETIGVDGPRSAVYACVDRGTGERFAVKIVAYGERAQHAAVVSPISPDTTHCDTSLPPRRAHLLREVDVLTRLRGCPGVLQIRDCFDDERSDSESGGSGGRMFIVTDLVAGGSLLSRAFGTAEAIVGSISEEEVKALMLGVFTACASMHSRGVVHRDIKLDNILLNDATDLGEGVKIAGLGLAAMVGPEPPREVCGTPMFVAPEILSPAGATDPNWAGYGVEVDIWSCGVLMYCVLSGSAPFLGENTRELLMNIRRGRVHFDHHIWRTLSPSAMHLVRQCLTLDPSKRITATEALQHPWLLSLRQPDPQPLRIDAPVML